MKKRKFFYFFPLASLILTGCTFQEGVDTTKEWIINNVYTPVKEWILDLLGKKENQKSKEDNNESDGKETEWTEISVEEINAYFRTVKKPSYNVVNATLKYSFDEETETIKAHYDELGDSWSSGGFTLETYRYTPTFTPLSGEGYQYKFYKKSSNEYKVQIYKEQVDGNSKSIIDGHMLFDEFLYITEVIENATAIEGEESSTESVQGNFSWGVEEIESEWHSVSYDNFKEAYENRPEFSGWTSLSTRRTLKNEEGYHVEFDDKLPYDEETDSWGDGDNSIDFYRVDERFISYIESEDSASKFTFEFFVNAQKQYRVIQSSKNSSIKYYCELDENFYCSRVSEREDRADYIYIDCTSFIWSTTD